MSKRRQQKATTTEGIVTSFLDRWEYEWDKSEKFNSNQRQAIKSFLYNILVERFESSLKLVFTSAELDVAIKLVKSTKFSDPKSKPYVHRDVWPDRQTGEFVDYYIRNQNISNDFGRSDLDQLWARLYMSAFDRYKARRYMCLSITQQEFDQALSFVENLRHKHAAEAKNDLRDEKIRAKRRVFAAHECVLHPYTD